MTHTLQLITSTDRRGAEVFATDLQTTLQDLDRNVLTLALIPGDRGGLPHEVLSSSTPGLISLARTARKRLDGVDVVAAHGSRTLPVTAMATFAHHVPFVYRNIGDPRFWVANRVKRVQVTVMLRRASAIAALWPRAAADIQVMHGIPAPRVHVIPNAVRAATFTSVTAVERAAARARLGLDEGQDVVAWIGSLSYEKGPQVAIDAVSALDRTHLLIAGDGPMRSDLETRSIHRAVTFLGQVQDPGQVLAAADVLMLTSRTEGMPAVLIEAGLRGLPVVATDVGGVREIVRDGLSGVLVEVGDVGQTVAALRRALDGGSEMGAAGREHCLSRFTFDTVGPMWQELLTAAARSA